MRARKEYRKNLQDFKSLLHHSHNGTGGDKDKLQLCESVGKIKGLGKQAKEKMNELSIHTIADLQLNVHHNVIPKVHI